MVSLTVLMEKKLREFGGRAQWRRLKSSSEVEGEESFRAMTPRISIRCEVIRSISALRPRNGRTEITCVATVNCNSTPRDSACDRPQICEP